MYEANDDLKLFRQAFVEAMHENTQMVLAEYPEKPVFSKRHKRVMKRILSGQRKPPIKTSGRILPRKRLIATFVAAGLLLLGGLTVYAKREAVIEFIEQIYEKFTKVSDPEEPEKGKKPSDSLEEAQLPAYVPDGFEMRDYQTSLFGLYIMWQNGEETIIFSLNIKGTVDDFDNELRDAAQMTIGSATVYVLQDEDSNTYIWNDEIYSYSLRCPAALGPEDVRQMIQSLPKIDSIMN